MQKKIIASVLAGKLAVGVSSVSAGALGKADSFSSPAPQLTIDEIGAPTDILTLPGNGGSKGSSDGVIYTQLAANQRIDFIINGVRQDRPVQVYLAYSKNAGRSDQWVTFTSGQGQLELDAQDIKVLAGLTIQPPENMGPFPATPFGRLQRDHESLSLPIQLSDLNDIGVDGDTIYFQAVAIPLDPDGNHQWELAQASEVDSFTIDRSSAANSEWDSAGLSGKTSSTTTSSIGGK